MQRTADNNNNNGLDVILLIIFAIILTAFVMLFHSCKQIEYVPVPVVENHTDTMYINKVKKDSIYLHDSTFIKEQGDTVFFEKWHTKYIEKQVHDTTYIAKHDSVPIPYETEKIVEVKYTPKFVKVLAWIGGIILFGGIIFLAGKFLFKYNII